MVITGRRDRKLAPLFNVSQTLRGAEEAPPTPPHHKAPPPNTSAHIVIRNKQNHSDQTDNHRCQCGRQCYMLKMIFGFVTQQCSMTWWTIIVISNIVWIYYVFGNNHKALQDQVNAFCMTEMAAETNESCLSKLRPKCASPLPASRAEPTCTRTQRIDLIRREIFDSLTHLSWIFVLNEIHCIKHSPHLINVLNFCHGNGHWHWIIQS